MRCPRQKFTRPIKFCKIIPVGHWKSRLLLANVMDCWIIGQLILAEKDDPTCCPSAHVRKQSDWEAFPHRLGIKFPNLIHTNPLMPPWKQSHLNKQLAYTVRAPDSILGWMTLIIYENIAFLTLSKAKNFNVCQRLNLQTCVNLRAIKTHESLLKRRK